MKFDTPSAAWLRTEIVVVSLVSASLITVMYGTLHHGAVAEILMLPTIWLSLRRGPRFGVAYGLFAGILAHSVFSLIDRTLIPAHFAPPLLGTLGFIAAGFILGTTGDFIRRIRRDLVEKEHLLTENARMRDQLESLLAKRTRERDDANEKLSHSARLEAVGRLAGGIAHDFNNQLTGVIGYADVLLDLTDDPQLRTFINRIRTSGKRASDLTRQLLDFARKGKYRVVTVNMHDSIEEALALLSVTITKSIRIDRFLHADTPFVSGDPSRLQSALLNILLNARDAIPEEGVITVRTGIVKLAADHPLRDDFSLDENEYLSIAVTDTGSGIEPHIIDKIFEPFFTTKDESGGTGMGLAAVFGIVQSHNGAIAVQSRPGKGTTINLYLPMAPICAPLPEEEAPPSVPLVRTEINGKGHILIVDDEEMVAEVLGETLQSHGYKTTVRNCPRAALDFYRDHHETIDLTLLDMIMPGMNGLELFTGMTQVNKEARAIMLSGYALDNHVEQAVEAGIEAFLQKPYESMDLLARIEKSIRQQ